MRHHAWCRVSIYGNGPCACRTPLSDAEIVTEEQLASYEVQEARTYPLFQRLIATIRHERAEKEKAEKERDVARSDLTALQRALVGNTGKSAILEAEAIQARVKELEEALTYIADNDGAYLRGHCPGVPMPKGYPGHFAGVARAALKGASNGQK